jgi:hypothetical protein
MRSIQAQARRTNRGPLAQTNISRALGIACALDVTNVARLSRRFRCSQSVLWRVTRGQKRSARIRARVVSFIRTQFALHGIPLSAARRVK